MEELFLAALLADAGVAAIAGDRAAWRLLPQGVALPALVLTLVTGGYDYVQDGRVDTRTPLVQVDCLAGDYATAKFLARAVVAACAGLDSDPFQFCQVLDERDDDEGD